MDHSSPPLPPAHPFHFSSISIQKGVAPPQGFEQSMGKVDNFKGTESYRHLETDALKNP